MSKYTHQPTGKPLGPPPQRIQSVFAPPLDAPVPWEEVIRKAMQDPIFVVEFKHVQLRNEISAFFKEKVEPEFFNTFCASCDVSSDEILRVFGTLLGGDVTLRSLVKMADVLGMTLDISFRKDAS